MHSAITLESTPDRPSVCNKVGPRQPRPLCGLRVALVPPLRGAYCSQNPDPPFGMMFETQKWKSIMSSSARRNYGNQSSRPPLRWANLKAPVTCTKCSVTWLQGDPALSLDCRGCGALAGEPCQRWGGGNEHVCPQRDDDAVWIGKLRPCESLTWDGRHQKPLRFQATSVGDGTLTPIRTGSPVSRFAA